MKVIIRPDSASSAELAARMIADALRKKPSLVLGLATGRTMERVYALLSKMHRNENLDFSGCRTFNLDEYAGISPDSPNSYRHYMKLHLFSKVNIDPKNTRLPVCSDDDTYAAGAEYEALIRKAGGIDFQLLGIGANGHIGFNEPLTALTSRTHMAVLAPHTIADNSPLFGDSEPMPSRAMTMGIGTILESRECILVATGSSKAEALAKAVEGPVSSMVPASALQFHPNCTIVADSQAAGRLEGGEYYRHIMRSG